MVVALLSASLPALALPTPSPGPFLPRSPITILRNADFTAANGVVSGTGLPGDPYVIAGWSITTSATAIRIHNVTAEFLVRDNALDAGIGVQITASASIGVVDNNKLIVRQTGVLVANADARIVNNSFIGEVSTAGTAKGVELITSNSVVESNAFMYLQYGVRAERGSPAIRCNDFHDDVLVAGITVRYTTNATIDCNVMTRCNGAISSVSAIGTVIVNNTITSCFAGIQVILTKDVLVANNTVRFSVHTQISLDTVSGNVSGNLVLDGQANAVVLFRSPVLFANNTISNHIGVGLWVNESSADVDANLLLRNGVGIALVASGGAHLTANVMANNTVGIDIPYGSRQAIVNLSANLVNGVNIDGAINASQKVFFYKEANVTIEGQVRDSGFSAGFFGSLTAQGGVVLYEVDTANVNATVVSHHNVGVGVVNSFNVNVNGSVIVSNLVGINASVALGGPQVPNCVVSVKNVNITIPVDPIATVGIDVKGCLAVVGRVNISVVDVGIRVNSAGSITLFNSTIHGTSLALDIQGSSGNVNLSGNLIVGNRAGARLSGTVGLLANNTFFDNDRYGVRLENSAQIDLRDNNFTANGVGLIDAEACLGLLSCSFVNARGNLFVGNLGNGAQMNGSSSWRGDVAAGNEGSGFVLGSATLRAVLAVGNQEDGARVVGRVEVEDSVFTGNDEDGLDLRGGGELRDSNFTFNEEAGIRVASTSVVGIHLNVSSNFDGVIAGEVVASGGLGTLSVPSVLAAVSGVNLNPNALILQRSVLMANERDAVRTGVALVNATHNFWGTPTGPSINLADTIGAFQNGVSPTVRFVPFYTDPSMTTTGPVAGL